MKQARFETVGRIESPFVGLVQLLSVLQSWLTSWHEIGLEAVDEAALLVRSTGWRTC